MVKWPLTVTKEKEDKISVVTPYLNMNTLF